jgi:3-carboxy-cis,cis-muconate cycloisomerase
MLSDAELEALLDPASYLGEAQEISRRILAAYPGFTGSPAKGAPRG